ncbi:DNA polymerase III subunit alpha [Clostridium botulinum]|uniref:DNA polymerase III subunit alpha n=1 Tax=Clostridium botulinum TaxID=1491 RepID=UPI001E3BBDCF|nr:DNA polymerase III subunit alpha [Clostridium botulinum]MCD3275582.1 DNA polymerase III subunit alpha [Clostridium botulinum C/D]MCD3286506.1 DNA polymerase III subunit alpha [Clostridium botulinum C/D]MCD3291475.1 DNA polymerase III subunit alpha [Clostridium botulinum C/D]MCD3303825.1 DNA polymerase III subunit alpha [Clostridium botulinum C/D]
MKFQTPMDIKNTIKTYLPYHIHTELSLLDSCTNYKEYIDLCVKYNIPAIAFSEHGNIMNWFEKKQYCDKRGIKFIFACEVYLTENLEEKKRDNYHTVLIAKNNKGAEELKELISLSNNPSHFYYSPRLTFDEFLSTSDNIISTSACLASPLNRLNINNQYYLKLANKYTYFEIQPHDYQAQRDYNTHLCKLAKKLNKPLILGTDTHSSTKYKAECRTILKTAKRMVYDDEDSFDLTFQTIDSLLEKYNQQRGKDNLIPFENYIQAIINTNELNNQIESVSFDTSFKYPNLYPDEEKYFKTKILTMYNEKVKNGVINGKNKKYKESIKEECKVFKKLGMFSFMLFMSELVIWCHENDIPTGFCRGSVGGSTIAYILDIIDVDPIKWGTIFSRFANEDRVSLGDIDLDFPPKDRDKVYKYIIDRFGEEYTCYILTTGTIADKGTIDEIARALTMSKNIDNSVKQKYSINNTKIIKQTFDEIQQEYTKIYNALTNKDKKSLDFLQHEKYLSELKELDIEQKHIDTFVNSYSRFIQLEQDYTELFYYFKGLKGTVINKGIHPAGIVASPVLLKNNIGLMYNEGKWVSQINMDELHDLNYVKYDILGLKNIGIIKDTYKLINSHYLKSHEINWNDQEVWNNIINSPVGIFQFEGKYAFELLKNYISRKISESEPLKINDLSLVNASLRPSGKSYRDRLIAGEYNHNPSKEIDELLKDNNGFLVFQEDTLKFLMDICGFTGSHADNVRRAIGGKKEKELEEELPKILKGYCEFSNKQKEQAEQEAKQFIQILSDSANYQFGYNHSTGYSMIGYNCGMLRYYYPLEFATAYLNNADNEADIVAGTELIKQLNITILPPKFRYSKSEYMCDKEQNSIYKGLSSIKYISKQVADELFQLKNEKYNDFIEVLYDLNTKTSINSRQLDILIKLNYFSEFGKSKKLLKITELADNLLNKKQIKKEKLNELSLTEDVVRKYAQKETEKLFKDIDMNSLIKEIMQGIKNQSMSIKDQLQAEIEYLGYPKTIIPKASDNFFYVTELKIFKNKRSITYYPILYSVKNGNIIQKKLKDFRLFAENPFKEGCIVQVIQESKEPKRKMVNGHWAKSETEFNEIIEAWEVY